MQVVLDRFAETLVEDEHAVMILDGAGWRTAKILRVPPDVALAPLPPHAPRLNPTEPVWLWRRGRFLSLRLVEGYGAIADACCAA